MSERYFIRLGKQSGGPFSIEQLQEELKGGRFGPAYQVSVDQETWTSARPMVTQLVRKRAGAAPSFQPAGKGKKPGASSGFDIPLPSLPADGRPVFDPVGRDAGPREPGRLGEAETTRSWQWTEDGELAEGTASLLELIDQIQTGFLKPYEFVRGGPDEAWRRADEVPEFSGQWDTPRLKWCARLALGVGAAALVTFLPAATMFVWWWARGESTLGYGPWVGVTVATALAAGAVVAGVLGYREWVRQFAPRSRERVWLTLGLGGSVTVLASSLVMLLARGLANWFEALPTG